MTFCRVFFVVTLLFFLVFEKTRGDSFQSGLQAYQSKDFKKAQADFGEALKNNPDNAAALTNLGLATYQAGQKSWAIAYFRKALSVSPGYTAAREGLEFALGQQEFKEIPHQIETYETLRDHFLTPVGELTYVWLLAASILLLGWSLLSYFGRRRVALDKDLVFPGYPWLATFSGILCALFLVLSGLKVYDLQILRATVVEDKVVAQSAPGENQVTLFELYGGFEVIIKSMSDDWVQVTYPGALTGWVKKSSLYLTSAGASL